MLLNKVLFVSLLVLGLCMIQPALAGERLATRIAGGDIANSGQLPFVALLQYQYTNSSGVTVQYQGTGVIYDVSTVITSANALVNCVSQNATLNIFQGVTFVTNTTGLPAFSVQCGTSSVSFATGFVAGTYFNDFAQISLGSSTFPANSTLRIPTSSPTPADIGKLFVAGYGEVIPGGQPSPVLLYVQINPERNHLCNSLAASLGLTSSFNFSNNFCLSGYVHDPSTGFLTDACTLDAGAPIFRTSSISAPYNDFEVVGILNFATCSDSAPAIASYLFKYLPTSYGGNGFLKAQVSPPPTGSPANPRAFDGNFACGDNFRQAGAYEKCDGTSCCDQWTCQLLPVSTACTLNNRNGTTCRAQPRCNKRGLCVTKFRNQGKACNGHNTKCHKGQCCTYPGATGCFI